MLTVGIVLFILGWIIWGMMLGFLINPEVYEKSGLLKKTLVRVSMAAFFAIWFSVAKILGKIKGG